MKKRKEKLNDGCLKICKMLQLLYEDDASYENVVAIFKDDLTGQTENNFQVILNKFLNALKVFGIKVVKKNNKYHLESGLYDMDLADEDLESLSIFISFINNCPDKEINTSVKNFLINLKSRMRIEDKVKLAQLSENSNLSFHYASFKKQIDICKKYCAENLLLYITYEEKGKIKSFKGAPKELVYGSKNAYLKVYDNSEHIFRNISLNSIQNIEQSPLKSGNVELTTTIRYKIKNRLVKTYKLKEDYESSPGFDDEGNMIVINKGEPIETLLPRLMRYLYNCEIESPKYLRDKMVDMINNTLKMYEIDDSE